MTAAIYNLRDYQSKKAVTQSEEMIKAANEIYNSIFPTDPNAFNAALHDAAPCEYVAPPQDSA